MNGKVRITVLGTGDTVGTPKINCDCEVCRYAREHGLERLRTCYLIESPEGTVLLDTSPDLRRQLIELSKRRGKALPKIDAVLWTHAHYDHISGYNEFYRVQRPYPPGYGAPEVLRDVADYFSFIKIEQHPKNPYEQFELFGVKYTFVVVNHPGIYTCGVILEANGKKVSFTADTNDNLPPETIEAFKNSDVMFIDALMPPDIHIGKHMNFAEAHEFAKMMQPKEFHIIHMSHAIHFDWPDVCMDGFELEI